MRWLAALGLVLLEGCSFATLQGARPVDPGMVELSPQLGVQLFSQQRYPAVDYTYTNLPLPSVDLALEGGVAKHLAIDGPVGLSGAQIGFKVLLTPSDW